MTASNSQALHAEVEALARRLRLPYLRKAAVEVLPTAKAQRWDPAEVIRVLLTEEADGRDAATIRNRRRRASFPTGKTFESWREGASSISAATQQALRTLEWIRRAENLAVVGPSGTGKSHLLEALGDLVVVDDIGLLPVPAEAAEALFRVIDAAYERRSVAISSNIHPGGFDQLLPTTIASAAVDRFMHHAHVVVTDGDSYRFAQARDGKGVTPLP
jgi:DNA replication protein DnaC